jgi:hypothetical protein
MPEPAHVNTRGLLDLLRLGTFDDQLSASSGLPIVFVDLDDDVPSDAADLIGPALLGAPLIVVGLTPGPLHAGAARLAAQLDAIVEAPAVTETIISTVRANPLASVSLAVLLRQELFDKPVGALVAESALYSALQAGPEFARWLETRPPERDADDKPRLILQRDAAVLHITLDRPQQRNALDARMRDALYEALLLGVYEPRMRVVLDAAGPAFCSGGDLAEFGSSSDPATAHIVRLTHSLARLLLLVADRTETRVHGACIGAGVELPAFTGRMVGARNSLFGLPELAMGLIPGAGGTVSLPRRIGRQRTLLLALHGCPIDASTALRWKLLDAID